MVDSFAGRTYKNVQRYLRKARKAVMRSHHFRIPIYDMPIRLRPVRHSPPSRFSDPQWILDSGLLYLHLSSCWSWRSSGSPTFPTPCRSTTNYYISCASGLQPAFFISSLTWKSARLLDSIRVSTLTINKRRPEDMVLASFSAHLHWDRLFLRRGDY
jgi:hypothetical protein